MNVLLLKAEIQKIWGRPIFELALFLVFFISIGNVSAFFEVTTQTRLESTMIAVVSESLVRCLRLQMLPLVLFSGLLVSLSFAQDYEQGLLQNLFSLPLSRVSIFVAKFVSIVVPLTLLSWGSILFVMFLNFQSTLEYNILVLRLTAWVLPITFLVITFYTGLGTMISLLFKRTTKASFVSILMGLFFWFMSQLEKSSIGALSEYMVFTPFKAPIITLGRITGLNYAESAIENMFPAWGFFVLILFYALVFLVPAYLYFTKKFEVKE